MEKGSRNKAGRWKKMKWRRRKWREGLEDEEGRSNGLLDIILAYA
jgi:hypothetical protein